MREVFGGTHDDEGRLVLHMGGDCPKCGARAVPTYSVCGRAVIWHTPTACNGHVWQSKQAHMRAKYPDAKHADGVYEEVA